MWQNLKQRIKQWRGIFTIAPSVAGLTILGSTLGAFQLLEWATLDRWFHLRPAESIDPRIVIVTIDEPDIQHVGEWPMSDRDMARLLKNIQAQQPIAIGLDIYRDLPVGVGHQELIEVFKSIPNLIGIEKVGGDTIDPPPTLSESSQVAASDLVVDADGKVRRGLILAGNREGLGTKLALMYLEEQGISLETVDEDKSIYQLGQARFIPLMGNEEGYVGKDGGGFQPSLNPQVLMTNLRQWWQGTPGGYQILLNYRGPLHRFKHISMTEVLENRIPPEFMRDRLVFIGATTPSLKDTFQTPYSSTLFSAPEPTPGVVVHANLTSQILSSALEGRPMLRPWGRVSNWMWILLWSFIGATGSWSLLQRKLANKNSFLLGTIAYILLAGGILGGTSYVAFLAGWVIPIFSPFFALSASAILLANYHNQWQLKRANEQLEDYSRTLEDRVAQRTQELSQALEDLKATQDELIQKEKMAALGQLVAGVAHEVNTPLGAIRSSVDNITYFLNENLEHLPSFFNTLSPEHYKTFFALLHQSAKQSAAHLSARERRKIRRQLAKQMAAEEIPKPENLADTLVDIGLLEDLDDFLPLLRESNSENIIETAYQLTSLRRNVRTIANASDRAAKVVFALKTYSHYDHSGEKSQVDVVSGIETVLTLYQNLLKQGVEVYCNYEESLPWILGYPDELNQVWTNLIHNALQAMDNKGTLILDVRQNNDRIQVAVTDNGKGIPPEIQSKIFQPFFTTKPAGEGSGLGLDIARKIVEKHQGRIEFESVPGQTTFTVFLPMKDERGDGVTGGLF